MLLLLVFAIVAAEPAEVPEATEPVAVVEIAPEPDAEPVFVEPENVVPEIEPSPFWEWGVRDWEHEA